LGGAADEIGGPVNFTHFIGIDWSGAKALPTYRHKLQIAVCEEGDAPPVLATPKSGMSRQDVLDWILNQVGQSPNTLAGFDFSFAPPYADAGGFLPGNMTPSSAKKFWHYVDCNCDDTDLGAAGFIDLSHRRHFYLGKADGEKAPYMRLRVCEQVFNAAGGGKPSSIFDAIGAAQVAKASFAGMRILHRLAAVIPVWPFDARPAAGPLVVEIYCRAFIRHAGLRGLKIRDLDTLNGALKGLGSKALGRRNLPELTDDMTDALVSAAGLRKIANDARYWAPGGLTPTIARTEGWTFGVL
jgi:hypothetical protein